MIFVVIYYHNVEDVAVTLENHYDTNYVLSLLKESYAMVYL